MTNVISRDLILTEAAALANAEGAGSNAKIELCMSMSLAAQARAITAKDAEIIFDTYLDAKKSAIVDPSTLTGNRKSGEAVSEGYARKTKSEWRQIIGCGAHVTADGPEALSIAKDVAIASGIHVYDALVKIARVQIKAQNTLTRPEIEAELKGEDKPKDTSEMKVLGDLLKAAEKVRDGIEQSETTEGRQPYPSDELSKSIELIRARLADITPSTNEAIKALLGLGYSEAQARAMIGKRK
jgi:hypothetical protein